MTVEEAARSPLAHRAPDLTRATDNARGAAEVSEVAFLAQADLRVDPGHAARLGLPLEANTATHTADEAMLWLAPDEWLVVGPPWTGPAIVAELEGRLRGVHHSVVDVSATRAVVELRGPVRHELLAKGCSLDFRRDRWTTGRCAQTLCAGVQVILEERRDATRVYVRRSFGDHLVTWLLDATVEFRLLAEGRAR